MSTSPAAADAAAAITKTCIWSSKLSKKLSNLNDASSKESLQTLAKWMVFHRKRCETSFCYTMLHHSNPNLVLAVINELLSLYSIEDSASSSSKWERLADLRVLLGEQVVLPLAAAATNPTATSKFTKVDLVKLKGFCTQWDSNNVFGGPTLMYQIIKSASNKAKGAPAASTAEATSTTLALSTSSAGKLVQDDSMGPDGDSESNNASSIKTLQVTHTTTTATASSAIREQVSEPSLMSDTVGSHSSSSKLQPDPKSATPTTSSTKQNQTSKTANNKIDPTRSISTETAPELSKPTPNPPTTTTESSATPALLVYDFTKPGVAPLDLSVQIPKDVIEPTRAIATLQIARDLRSDSANHVSSLLAALSEPVRRKIAQVAETGSSTLGKSETQEMDAQEEDETDWTELCKQTPDALLDLDLAEQRQAVRTFRDVVVKQQDARQAVVRLLQASRCQFHSDEYAAAFYQTKALQEQLQHRATVLADAMELEGVVVLASSSSSGNNNKDGKGTDELPPLSWYAPLGAAVVDENSSSSTKRHKVE
jgi:hypothetical protein